MSESKTTKSLKKKHNYRRIIHQVLTVIVLIVMVRQFFLKNYMNVFTCLLTLLLFMIPTIVDRQFKIKLPLALEMVIMFFIFAAEIMGEIHSFYTIIPIWDTILHVTNGFIMAGIGFAMIDILNRDPRFHISLSPIFVAIVSFCFSMTIGVIWEFFEFSMDYFFLTDMQKDWFVPHVSSVLLNPSGRNDPILIKDITQTVISGTVNGVQQDWIIENAYLDIGLIDTMKDLMVNCVGAIVFSIFGYFYITGRGESKIAPKFIPQLKTEDEIKATEEQIRERKQEYHDKRNKRKNK